MWKKRRKAFETVESWAQWVDETCSLTRAVIKVRPQRKCAILGFLSFSFWLITDALVHFSLRKAFRQAQHSFNLRNGQKCVT